MLAFALFSLAGWALLTALAAARSPAQRARALAALGVGAGAALLAALTASPSLALDAKIVGRLAMPAGLVFLALWATALVHAHRRAPLAAAASGLTLLLYMAAGNVWLGAALVAPLEAPYVQTDPLNAAPFDAVFVLGGGTSIDPQGRVYLTRAGDRVALGARLYHAGRTPILVASGSSPPGTEHPRDAATESAEMWVGLGVPSDAIVKLPAPTNTSEELRAYAALATERGWQRVGLVSSAWHLPRVMRNAERVGLDATPLAADRRGIATWAGFETLVPTGAGFDLVHRGVWERLGVAVGR
jgi:uncharacterized SAM-binding protein YcdF (DUF218 family)